MCEGEREEGGGVGMRKRQYAMSCRMCGWGEKETAGDVMPDAEALALCHCKSMYIHTHVYVDMYMCMCMYICICMCMNT